MPITYFRPAYADITMFGDVAIHLLKMMEHSGTVPVRCSRKTSLPRSSACRQRPVSLDETGDFRLVARQAELREEIAPGVDWSFPNSPLLSKRQDSYAV